MVSLSISTELLKGMSIAKLKKKAFSQSKNPRTTALHAAHTISGFSSISPKSERAHRSKKLNENYSSTVIAFFAILSPFKRFIRWYEVKRCKWCFQYQKSFVLSFEKRGSDNRDKSKVRLYKCIKNKHVIRKIERENTQ